MLKWVLGISAVIAVAVLAVVYNPSFLWVSNDDEVVDDKTRRFCRTFFKDSALIDDVTTKTQYDATCRCFAEDVLEKAGRTPADDINDAVLLQEVEGIAAASIKKCVDQSGLN